MHNSNASLRRTVQQTADSSANTHMPTEAGTVIRQHSFIAVAAFCSIICHLFKAKASETAGTRLVASDIVGIVAIKSKGCAMPAR